MPDISDDRPLVTAWPAIDTVDDLTRLQRFQRWNLAPWVDTTGGRVELPEIGEPIDVTSADALLFWNQAETIGASRAHLARGIAVDPLMDISASDTLNRWVAAQLGEAERAFKAWPQAVERLRIFIGDRPLLILGSGPHTKQARHTIIQEQPVPLILGTALADTDLIAALPPGIILCADGAGQFGATPAAQTLIGLMTRQLHRGAHLVVTEELGPLARHALDALAPHRIHSTPMGGTEDRLWQTGRSRPQGNVLTTLGLPVAAAIVGDRPDPAIDMIGISLSPSNSNGATHWTHETTSTLLRRKANDLLVQEPGSVLPVEGYLERHYAALSDMIREMQLDGFSLSLDLSPIDPQTDFVTNPGLHDTPSRRWRARLVKGLDWLETRRHAVAVILGMTIALSLSLTGSKIAGLSSAELLAIVIALSALLVCLLTGLFLRLRVRRWQAIFERRRRLMEARAVELLSDRLAAVEDRLDAMDASKPQSAEDSDRSQ